jgi:hypothetical protein
VKTHFCRKILGWDLAFLLALGLAGCQQERSAYHSGVVGPDDPSVPSLEEAQKAGQVGKPGSNHPAGHDPALRVAPPREEMPHQKPAETFSSAAGGDSSAPNLSETQQPATE